MAAKKEKSIAIPADKIALYDALINTIEGVVRKGDTTPYTSLNGHMFSLMDSEGTLGLRLPKATLEEFLTQYNTHLREAYGIIQKEYAVVPAELFKNTTELAPYFAQSYNYVKGLKPKPTTKKK